MDNKQPDDDQNKEEIISALNNCLPTGIKVYDVTEPVMKAGKIAQALFEINLYPETVDLDTLYNNFTEVLNQPEILVMKKTNQF